MWRRGLLATGRFAATLALTFLGLLALTGWRPDPSLPNGLARVRARLEGSTTE